MNYGAGAAALIGLCLSSVLMLAALSWMVNHRHTRLTMAWLFGLALLIVLQSLEFLYHAADLFLRWPVFLKLVDPLVILLPLTLYGYIRALQGDNILHRPWHATLHFAPALLVALLAIPYWSLPAAEKIDWMLQVRIDEGLWQPLAPYGNTYLGIIAVLSLCYWGLQQRLGYRGRKPRLARWISELQTLQLIIALSLLARIILSTLFGLNLSMVYVLAPTCGWLLYLLLTHSQPPQPHSGAVSVSTADLNRHAAGEADAPAPVAGQTTQALLFAELEAAMAAGAFRDNELSLGKLASQCGLTTHQASAAINQCSGRNFYDWVNDYRIRAAQDALRSSDTSVAQICYDVGFNSKSTFNTAFRRLSGVTPSEYRRQHSG